MSRYISVPEFEWGLYQKLLRQADVVTTTNALEKKKIAWFDELAKAVKAIKTFQKTKEL